MWSRVQCHQVQHRQVELGHLTHTTSSSSSSNISRQPSSQGCSSLCLSRPEPTCLHPKCHLNRHRYDYHPLNTPLYRQRRWCIPARRTTSPLSPLVSVYPHGTLSTPSMSPLLLVTAALLEGDNKSPATPGGSAALTTSSTTTTINEAVGLLQDV